MGVFWDFENFADSPALIADTGVTVTYRDLSALSKETAAAISRCADWDAASEPLVMMVCRNTMGALSGYAVLADSGYPFLPVSADLAAGMRRRSGRAHV